MDIHYMVFRISNVEGQQSKDNSHKEILTCLIKRDRELVFGELLLCGVFFRYSTLESSEAGKRGLDAFQWAAQVIDFSWCTGRHSSWAQVRVSSYTSEERQQIKYFSPECRRTRSNDSLGEEWTSALTIHWCMFNSASVQMCNASLL